MRIQWDAALVAATARALDRRFAGERIRAFILDPEPRRLVVYLRAVTLVFDLHPTRLGMRILDPCEPPPEARRLPAKLSRVWSPPDDRILVLETRRVRGKPPSGALILELFPNQENAVITEGDSRTVRVLLRTREGDRPLRRGQPYHFPPPSERAGAEGPLRPGEWDRILEGTAGVERRRTLLRKVAWSSPLVVDDLLGEDGEARWTALARPFWSDHGDDPEDDPEDDPGAAVLAGRHGPQPYPAALEDRTLRETDDLLEAFREAEAMGDAPGAGGDALLPGALLERLNAAVERARSRVGRLESELDGLGDPEERQGWGDLLLARFHEIPEGRDSVELEGFDGTPVRIPLDPGLSPDANARRHYDRAAKLRRAAEELPPRIEEARRRWSELEELKGAALRGEVERSALEERLPPPGAGRAADGAPLLPYRRYRSSGGHEIRVGRGATRNDDLTFRHARPDDIWLHARHTAGAHVILRWNGEGSPPPRDLEEAAVLAALNSRARTSGSVPVDWTRRKHVRKPRKSAPGAVIPDRVKTVFVAPDEALEARLRVEE